jgi:hypothetical protein
MTKKSKRAMSRVRKSRRRPSKPVDWYAVETIALMRCVREGGFYARVIGQQLGMSTGQVYYRCKQLGISLRGYRGAETTEGMAVLAKCCDVTKTRAKAGREWIADVLNAKEEGINPQK